MRVAKSKPLAGAILGILIGLAIAVILQQQGIWPLDKITVFLLPAATGAIGVVILRIKGAPSRGTLVITLIILIPMAIWGATGLTTINEVGVLNGGCEVFSQTSVPDQTSVTDSSKRDPFLIDPQGSLEWGATSPVAFDDYPWKIWVEIGGVQVTLDSESSEDNDGGSQVNGDSVANIEAYAAERGIDVSQLRGVYKVGGDAANTCDGFGFVKLIADPLETLIAKIAAGLLILLLIILIVLVIVGRRRPLPGAINGSDNSFIPGDIDGDGDVDFDDYAEPGRGPGDPPELFADGFESGDPSSWSDTDPS